MKPPIVRATLVLLAVLAAGGCRTFQPVSYDEVAPGQKIRARVNSAWADSLDALLQRDGRVVEGTVVEKQGGSALLLEIAVQNELRGIQFQTLSQRVLVPREGFVELELRELDRGRTVGVLALASVVVGAFVVQQLSKDTGGGTLPGGGGPGESRILRPVFSIPLP